MLATPLPPTTAQSLGALLKSARDIMRKDKGLNGDLDRLPMLTWIMFLKFLDDLELQREDEAKLAGKKFKPAIEAPYRWRDWAAKSDGITGDELLAFINNEEATLPNGKKGAGLFAYLRKLTSSDTASAASSARDTVATVFKGVDNRMKSGYLLRDVVNKIAGSTDSTPHPRPLPVRGGEGENPAMNCRRWARSTNPCSARCAMLRARSAGVCSASPAARPQLVGRASSRADVPRLRERERVAEGRVRGKWEELNDVGSSGASPHHVET